MGAALAEHPPQNVSRAFAELVVIRLADEGIPVRAIARSVKLPSNEVYEVLKTAFHQGTIVEMPKDEWPIGSTRNSRRVFSGTKLEDEDELRTTCTLCFRTSRLETYILCYLLKRNQATKAQLHQVIEGARPGSPDEPTDEKMVDVMIHHVRKKLRPHKFQINTVWGMGYLIPAVDRKAIIDALIKFANAGA